MGPFNFFWDLYKLLMVAPNGPYLTRMVPLENNTKLLEEKTPLKAIKEQNEPCGTISIYLLIS